VPGATAQTALLEQLSLRPDGSLAASGSQAVVDLPGLAKSTASTFGFERRGTAFRLKLGNVLLAFNALPGLSTRWDLELGPNLFSALCTASGALSCGFGTRLSIYAAQWSVQSTGFQSLTVSAKSGTVRLLGAAPLSVAAGGAVSLALAANATLSGQLSATGTVTLMPGLLELGVQRIGVSGGAAPAVTVEGRLRALAGAGGTGWLVDVAMNAALGANEFQTSVIASGRSLFASNELALTADLGFGRDASGFYLALSPLRVSYLGVALVDVERKLRAGASVSASWGAVHPPVAIRPGRAIRKRVVESSCTDRGVVDGRRAASYQLIAGPAGKTSTPALQCQWNAGGMAPGSASVTFAGNDGGWQTSVPGVRYRIAVPAVRVRLALGAGAAASVVAGLTLTGARLQIETLAKRPDTDQPWVSADAALGDTTIGLDGRLTLMLPALSPGTDPLSALRAACEKAARNANVLPSVPDAPPSWAPASTKNAYNAALSNYNDIKTKLEEALSGCAAKFPAPPSAASFGGRTIAAGIKDLFTLR
jgi:hypothetical protein